MEKKTVMLAVQGEGRGHMTQAIAVLDMLKKSNMEVCCVIVGSSNRREIPDFFRHKFDVPVIAVQSPNFTTGKDNKSIQIGKTIWNNTLKLGAYQQSLAIIHKLVGFHNPDIIINFFEPLIGLYRFLYTPQCKIISIAHQYIYLHPKFRFPKGSWIQKQALIRYTRFTTLMADKILAISLYDLPGTGNSKLTVIPPLLRKEVSVLQSCDEQFLLVYLLNSGYINDILQWHASNPEVKLHCFTDSKKVKETYSGEWKVDDALSFHSLNDVKFLDMMSRCSGMASTAGFESVCEAMYLGKPVMMVPVEGHFEQYCNALDAGKMGAGIHSRQFKLEKLIAFLPFYNQSPIYFQQWVNEAEKNIMNAINSLYPNRPGNKDQYTATGRLKSSPLRG